MTLGKKLSCYRKLAGMTQQQLGAHLNLSAQAISKWEKDLTEPDLSTLRALAELYKVTVDELLDPEGGFPDAMALNPDAEPVEEEQEIEEATAPAAPPQTLGFCKRCGVVVTEENVGSTEPVVLCKKCEQARAEEEAAAERKKKLDAAMAQKRRDMEQKQAAAEKAARQQKLRRHRNWSFVVAGLAASLFLTFCIIGLTGGFSFGMLAFSVVGTYVVFSYVCCLFYDCFIQSVLLDWAFKSIQWPGLIFTFDVDGIIWLIGMKILFFVLGLLFGFFTTAIGIIIGLVCAPFVFPFQMRKLQKGIREGAEKEEFV